MKPFTSRLRLPHRSAEDGIALAESMVAAVIIVLVLTANALGLLAAYNAYGSAENFGKAYQIVNKQFSYFKAAPWSGIGTAPQTSTTTGCDIYTSTFNSEPVASLPVETSYGYTTVNNGSPFQFCQGLVYPYNGSGPQTIYNADESVHTDATNKTGSQQGLGITFYYQTVFTNVTSASFDGSNSGVSYNATNHYTPKRMTVTVRWSETDSSGNTKTQMVRMSEVRTPLISECVSPTVKDASGNQITAAGC